MKFERLQPKFHDRHAFDCGEPALNQYLRHYAHQDQKRGLSRVYVLAEVQQIVGYYSISAHSVASGQLTDVSRVGAYREVPFLLLGRLAVDKRFQGRGYGDALLIHAFKITAKAADEVGIFGIIVDAKNEQAANFYEKFGFKRLSGSPWRLVLPFSAIKRALEFKS